MFSKGFTILFATTCPKVSFQMDSGFFALDFKNAQDGFWSIEIVAGLLFGQLITYPIALNVRQQRCSQFQLLI